MNLYLTGYRCTGKTTLSKILGQALNWPVLDTDAELVKTQGRTIADIVAEQGWDVFRDMETETLEKVSTLDHHVIATGGGIILRDQNIDLMHRTGKVVWLKATPETIRRRMAGDDQTADNRPSLTDKGIYDEIVEVLKAREPRYRMAMDLEMDTDTNTIEEISTRIREFLKSVL